MVEKFGLMSGDRIVRDDVCISLAMILKSVKKCLDSDCIVVNIGNVEISSLRATVYNKIVLFEMMPGTINVSDLRLIDSCKSRKLKYSDTFNYRRNIKKVLLDEGRVILYT